MANLIEQSLKQPSEAILFFTPFGYWQVHTQLDLAVASAAGSRGLRTTSITCNAVYQPCSMERGENVCDACQGSMREIAAPFGISGEPLGTLIQRDEIEKAGAWVDGLDDTSLVAATYEDLEVGDWALSSVMTHFRIGSFADLGRPEIVKVHRRFLRDTLLTYWAIGRVIDRDRIDAAFLFNARFYPYRAALEVSLRKGLRVLVHERGRVANSFTFFENESCLASETTKRLVADWADDPLDDSALQQIDQHFSQLLLGRSPSWPSFYDKIRTHDPREVLDIPADAPIVAFFSSSSDEIAAQISFAKVTSQFALIEDIAAILEEAGIYLIVRHHPHIGGGPVGSPVEPSSFFEAYARAASRRSNVRIVMPKDELTSYAIFPYLKAAIAPFTSLGLEATAFGIPTLVALGSISSFDPRYTVDDWSPAALKQKITFILGADAQLDGERLRTFYRTFYSRFHRLSMRIAAVAIKDYIEPSVHPDFAELVRPGRDDAMDRVMDCLVDGRHVHARPDPDSHASSRAALAAEDAYIAGRLQSRLDFRRQKPEPAPDQERHDIAILCEETTGGLTSTEALNALPNADRVSIVPFYAEAPTAWYQRFGSRESIAFKAWSRGLRAALRTVREDHILVLSKHHQLHDASLATILSHFGKTASAEGRMLPISGWIGDKARLQTSRLSASTLDMTQWRELRKGYSGNLRGQDLLSFGIVEKAWLCDNLKSEESLQRAFFDLTAKTTDAAINAPVVFWCAQAGRLEERSISSA